MSCCDRNHPQKGDRVAIIREEHGWHDGSIQGVVISVFCQPKPKGVSYNILGDDGIEYYCKKTRDCYRMHK